MLLCIDSPGLTAGRGLKHLRDRLPRVVPLRFARPNRRARIETSNIASTSSGVVAIRPA